MHQLFNCRSIESYTATGVDAGALFKAVGEFIGVFGGSFILGGVMGLLTALVSFFHASLTNLIQLGLFFVFSLYLRQVQLC